MTDIPSEPGESDAVKDGSSPAPASDAEWEAFQRDVEESVHGLSQGGPVPKEPSARARMVAARLRELDENAAREAPRRWGRKKKEPEPWQPDGWRTSPTGQSTRGGGHGRWRQSRRVGAAFAVLAVLLAGLWFADHRGYLDLDAAGLGGVGTADPADAPPAPTIAGLSAGPPLPEGDGHANG